MIINKKIIGLLLDFVKSTVINKTKEAKKLELVRECKDDQVVRELFID